MEQQARGSAIRCARNGSRRYTIALVQAHVLKPLLWSMYEPMRETLRRGLMSRAEECSYEVLTTQVWNANRTMSVLDRLVSGDVIILVGSCSHACFGTLTSFEALASR